MSLILGASAGALHSLPPPYAIASIGIAIVVILALLRVGRRFVGYALTASAVVLIGWAMASLYQARAGAVGIPADGWEAGAKLVCDARVVRSPESRDGTSRTDVRLVQCRAHDASGMAPARGTVRMYGRGFTPDVVSGDTVRFKGTIRLPRDFRNPGGFRWSRFLLARGIGAVGSFAGPEWIMRITEPASGITVRVRERLARAIDAVDDPAAAGIINALVSGDRGDIPERVNRAFRRLGIAHLLAISGLHVGYIALFVYLAVALVAGGREWLTVRVPVQRIAAAATLPVVWCFVSFVGMPVSGVRAAIMISVYLVGVMSGRRQDMVTTLAFAALLIIVIEPLAVLDVSFQLSFVSVLAIIIAVPRLMQAMRARMGDVRGLGRRLSYRAVQLIAVTAVATVGAAPLVAYHFKMVTAAGLLANLFAVPWVGFVILPAAAAASLMTLCAPGLAATFAWPLAGHAAQVLADVAVRMDDVVSPLVVSLSPAGWDVILVYAVMLVVALWPRLAYRRILLTMAAAALAVQAGWVHARPLFMNELSVTFFDVGQGDAMMVRFPDGRVLVIDGGGLPRSSFDVGANVLAPALLHQGVRHADWLMLSHPHHDHYRGLGAVAEQFHPAAVWTNGHAAPEEEREFWHAFLERVNATGAGMKVLDADHDPIVIGDATLEILYPPPDMDVPDDLNDTSLVAKLTYGAVSFLFTGDLTTAGERILLDDRADVAATVLKVGHHGSETSTSSAFLDAVNPGTAVITVGQGNHYGMPDQIVLDRLNERGVDVYRTDLHGAVTIRTDGTDISCHTFVN